MNLSASIRTGLAWLLLAAAIAPRAHGATADAGLQLQVPVPPTPIRVEGHWQLRYELRLANRTATPLTLQSLSLRDAQDGHVIAQLAGEQLARSLRVDDAPPPASPAQTALAPGAQAVLFVDLALPQRPTPGTLRQRVDYRAAGASRDTSAPLALSNQSPPLLAPPLRGGPWVAIHSPDWPRGHRRVYYRVDGQARLPGRYAIDWVKLDDRGRTASGDADQVQAWYGYGAEVLAVADARVAAVRDNMAEPARVSQRTRHAPQDDAGNYVALQLADGRLAFYEHLKPGSIRVAVGDRVAVGEVIAALGFSGESTGPHLHFHVADANSPLGAEGLPFALRHFRRLGRYAEISRLGHPWQPSGDDTPRQREWPDSNTVVRFPDHPPAATTE